MESNTVVQCQSKLQQLFQKFLEPDFEIKTDTYLNRLLTHLSSQEKTDDQIFTDWLLQAVTIWESQKVTPSAKIAFFTLNLASLVSRNEGRFCHLSGGNFYISLINVVKARQPETTPAVKLGYIKLMRAFLEHKSGIQWIVGNDLWIDILKLSLTNQTVYITREGYRFIAKLLEQTVDVDEEFCHRVVKEIMVPLGDSTYKTIKPSGDMMEISDETVYQNLSPTLQLIGDTLEYFLESVLFTQNDCRIVLIFLRDFHLEQQICNLMMIAQNKYLVFDLGKIMFIMQFLELYIGVISNNLKMGNVKTSVRKIMSIFRTNFSKGNYENVMKLCYYGQLYWNLMGYKIPCMKVNKDNEPISFANQLLVIQLLPIFAVAMKYCVGDSSMIDSDEFRDQYVQKFFMMMCENTVRIAYGWRDFLTSQTNLFEIATKGLIYIMKSRKYYPRERAAMTFQSFVYTLKDVMRVVKEAPEKIAFFSQQVGFFSLLFDAFVVFIEEFQITWRDSVETICVMSICFDFLSIPTWPTQLVVKALKLVNVSIVKYMSPNLALLVDRTTDSTMAVLGPLLYTKLHDMTWEVRDSAMEVVCTMSHLSNTKFPSLQKVLMDSELPTLVVKMSTCDSESFVRATAIKCLQEMIQVEEIWNNALKSEDLPQKMRDVLLNETEGIVRVEAATFMCVAYENQQFPKDNLHRLYETMIYASTTDLHWEVKVRALDFWDKVIKNHLQNQGMIDGSFPNVTFSKEHRKIVTLTDSEIRKRLLKVLSQLSSIGCLGVLMSAIKDDCDMEVSKTAAKITQRLVELFKKYNVRSDGSIPTSPLPTENGMSTASVSSGISVDESMDSPSNHHELNEDIIDQIVNSKDVCLLRNVYAPSEYSSVSNYDIQVRRVVTPNEFLQFTQQDLNTIISEKKNWLNGIEDLGSLLDDMLKTYENDVNNMDCY
ncbi:uncharacterized protein LOC123016210 isoform X4 [Tribolium madens]|uniref:uncharacterized protein LOC123016210 isoform X4 n=1 Tax=Tribolium madens TaxID=41895 RepID=UPI001CF75AF3|nr:uncharacterized protein LOC123016210 isoform X4 [Tribolium madens]